MFGLIRPAWTCFDAPSRVGRSSSSTLTASPPAEEEFIARRSKSPRLVELLRPEHLLVGLQKLLARFAGEGLG